MSAEGDHYSIPDAISGVFRGYGARTAPSNTDPMYLRVVLGDTRIAVGYSLSDVPPDPDTLAAFLDTAEDTFFHFFVFISNHDLSREVVTFAHYHSIILLDRHDLELELGRSHLRSLELFSHPRIHPTYLTGSKGPGAGGEEVHGDIGEWNGPHSEFIWKGNGGNVSDGRDGDVSEEGGQLLRRSVQEIITGFEKGDWMDDGNFIGGKGGGNLMGDVTREGKGEKPEKPELIRVLEKYRKKHALSQVKQETMEQNDPGDILGMGIFEDTILENDEEEGRGEGINAGNIYEEELEEEVLIEDLPSIVQQPHKPDERRKGSIIRPRIPVTKLEDLCSSIAPITNSQMELIPYYLFSYSCITLEENSDTRKPRSGILGVNGVTLEVEEWEPGFPTINELPMDYIRLNPRADEKVARDLARSGVVQINTRVLEVVTESQGLTMNRSKKSYPDTSSIRLVPEGLHYFPHWHVRGERGSMFVDAVNGDIISTQNRDHNQ